MEFNHYINWNKSRMNCVNKYISQSFFNKKNFIRNRL